jgi:hypothetical protein
MRATSYTAFSIYGKKKRKISTGGAGRGIKGAYCY